MHNADIAMYTAKKRGSGQYCFFNQAMQASAHHRISVTNALHGALANNEFHLAYQPKIDIITGKPRGAEARLRWNNADLGSIPPSEFIPIAEETGLIIRIGDWVLNEACRAVKRWRDAGTDLEQVAVNVSAMQFSQAGFVERVADILLEAELPAAALELELTESLLASDANHATTILT
jgi:EAL domain-containing protein (putative c-di-GMP-specific phosphodiesterase class I)